jgi:alpha-N-arabinofuranosidase
MRNRVTVYTRNPGRKVDRRIYGHFIENMARCTYGGILTREKGLHPSGPWKLNRKVVDLIRQLEPPVVRWPGGLYADGYHFRDGLGPVESRPLKRNRYWSRYGPLLGFFDPNAFGTHEFMELMTEVGASPYVNVNFGTGSAAAAASWVEYANSGTHTTEGARRAGNGREEPWGVRTWGLGNEAYGIWSLCHMRPKEYARRYLAYRTAMTEVDPGLEFVAVGADHYFSKSWNREVLSCAAGDIDLLSVHVYLPGPERIAGVLAAQAMGGSARTYAAITAAPVEYERRLREVVRDIDSEAGGLDVGIAFDEWNLWWSVPQLQAPRWRLRDAIFACGVFHAMNRLSDRVKVANLAQLVNVLGLISTRGESVCRTAMYYPFLMYSRMAGPESLDVECVTSCFETRSLGGIPSMTDVPVLDCVATRSADGGSLTLFTINRDPDATVTCTVSLDGASPGATVTVVTLDAADVNARNTFADDEIVSLRRTEKDVGDILPEYSFPAHSVTAMVFGLR